MDWWLAFAIFLYLICAALIVAEVFIPSAGLLSLCALICLGTAISIFFRHSTAAGWIGVIVGIVMVPLLLAGAYHLLPRTRFGREVLLAPPRRDRGAAISDTEDLGRLVGQVGRVLTPMRPVGMCAFDGRKVECVAESGYVERDWSVKVIRVEGRRVTVRAVEPA